jgi:phosphoribosylformylglycinamidine (FGAM) synthase-like amidotransferase family enzyme
MKTAVIVFPGSNRDRDMFHALELITGTRPAERLAYGKHPAGRRSGGGPGGFSYGDYLRSGAIAARSPILKDLVAKADSGVSVLGVCNGFQILTEAGLLPGALMRNAGLTFVCKEVLLETVNTATQLLLQVRKRPGLALPGCPPRRQLFRRR